MFLNRTFVLKYAPEVTMIIGSLKEVNLSQAKEIFLFNCRVVGWDSDAVSLYRHVLSSFIRFTGELRVKQLRPDHVRMYITNLSDGPNEGEDHSRAVLCEYAMIQSWLHWIYSQNLIYERSGGFVQPPRLTNLFSSRLTRSLTNYQVRIICALLKLGKYESYKFSEFMSDTTKTKSPLLTLHLRVAMHRISIFRLLLR